jgi:hypothetical protein
MKLHRLWLRQRRDERGASLVLAIVFMVVVGAVGGGVLASISSGIRDGATLATVRNREYAADAAIESSIASVRIQGGTTNCSSGWTYNSFEEPPVPIDVACTNALPVAGLPSGSLALQNDVTFNACLPSAGPCKSANAIISADVSFQTSASPVGTDVLSWSVNG